MLDHKVIQSGGDGSRVEGSLKAYYEVLGLPEGASMEEVTARYMVLKKQIIYSIERGRRPDKTIPEINEAFFKLKQSKIPESVNFDLEEHLRRSFATARAEKRRVRRKKIVLASCILAVFLGAGISFLMLGGPKGTLLPGSTSKENLSLKTKGSLEEAHSFSPLESKTPEKKTKVTKAIPKEPEKSPPPEAAKPVAPHPSRKEPSPGSIPKPAPPLQVAKAVPQKASKPAIAERAGPVQQEPAPTPAKGPGELKPKVGVPVVPPPPKPAPPAKVAKAVPQEASKPAIAERAGPVQQEPAPTPAKGTGELKAKAEVPVVPPPPKPAPPAKVAKAAPEKATKIAKPESAKAPEPMQEKEPPKVASIAPQPIASELEVRTFFENYLVKYNRKEINGFMSLFSAKAIQNQKDDINKIRKSYEYFFDHMESVDYHIAITSIEPKQDRLEVKGQYDLEGIVAKGRKKQDWKGRIRWVLIREGRALKIISLDYQPQSSN